MNAFFHHFAYDFRTGLRDKTLMLMNYLFPLVFYVFMGVLMIGINPGFRDTIVPAMITMALMAGCLLGLPNPIVSAREAGIYRSFKINGVPALSIITIPMLGVIAHMILVSAIITLTARPLFSALMPVQWGYFLLITLVSAFAMAGAGMLIGVISANGRMTVLLAQAIFIPAMMLGGLMMPTSMLPAGLAKASLLLPASHAMNAFNGLAFGLPAPFDPTGSLLVLLGGGILAFLLSVILFDWDSRNRRAGRSPYLAVIALLPYVLSMVLMG